MECASLKLTGKLWMFRNPKIRTDIALLRPIENRETDSPLTVLIKIGQCFHTLSFMPKFMLLLLLFISSTVGAQQGADKAKMAAISNIIMFLLNDNAKEPIERPDGQAIELSLNEIVGGSFSVSDGQAVFAEFELQNQSVEFCFDLSTQDPITGGAVVVEVNGEPAPLFVGNDNCFVLPRHQQRDINYILVRVNRPGITVTLSRVELAAANLNDDLGLATVSRGGWDQQAVRKVLRVFAFGGQASTAQIQTWADMDSELAILQMLNFSEHNARLSPVLPGDTYPQPSNIPGTLDAFLNYISSSTSSLPIPVEIFNPPNAPYRARESFGVGQYRMDEAFQRMVVTRGLNPFRQKIGFWETNYHLAVNLDAGVEGDQLVVYYDLIMEAHEQGLPYKDVIATAAKSAAVATQYNHRFNQWFEGSQECACNDDFAREIHQLFYGIFGVDDPEHENGTIRETAKMLTDMRLLYSSPGGLANQVDYQTEFHHQGDLTILGSTVSGANAAAKIDDLMPISMQHPESLQNLPIMIIEVLADDNLSQTNKRLLRAAWASLGVDRKLLDFIHSYAISKMFHSPQQLKYASSFDRAFYTANKFNIDNIESLLSNNNFFGSGGAGKNIDSLLLNDAAGDVFRPLHNVFGGQTALQASDSARAFEGNYNTSVPAADYRVSFNYPAACTECDNGGAWRKDWSKVIPAQNETYTAEYVARWLWMHVVGNMDNYKSLEQAHILAILGANHEEDPNDTRYLFWDINYLLCLREDRVSKGLNNNSLSNLMTDNAWWDFCRRGDDGFIDDFSPLEKTAFNRVLSTNDIENTPYIGSLIQELAISEVPLNSNDDFTRLRANERVQAALAFIFATPFVFAEGE